MKIKTKIRKKNKQAQFHLKIFSVFLSSNISVWVRLCQVSLGQVRLGQVSLGYIRSASLGVLLFSLHANTKTWLVYNSLILNY